MWEDRYEWVSLLGDPHKVETYKEGKNRFINLDSEVQGNMYSLSKNATKLILLLICEVGLLYFIGGWFFLVNPVFILVPCLFELLPTAVHPSNFIMDIRDSVLLNIFICSSIHDTGYTLRVLFVAGHQELKLFNIFFFNFTMTWVYHSKIHG